MHTAEPRPATLAAIEAAAASIGHRRAPRLAITDIAGPACVGVLRLWIAVPARLEEPSRAAELECVLLHELAHLRRWDSARRLLALAICTLFWFHPAAWIATKRLSVLAEFACDHDASSAASGGAPAYRAALLGQAALLLHGPESPSVRHFLIGPGVLVKRISVLSAASRRLPRGCEPAAALLLFGGALAALGPRGDAPRVVASAPAPAAPAAADPAPFQIPPIDELQGCLSKRYAVMAAIARQQAAAPPLLASTTTTSTP